MSRKTLTEKVADLITTDTTVEELEEANRYIVHVLREKAATRDRLAALQFRTGDKVRYKGRGNRRLSSGAIGVIERFGARLVSVDFGYHGLWRVPASDLEIAPPDAEVKPSKLLFPGIPVKPPSPVGGSPEGAARK